MDIDKVTQMLYSHDIEIRLLGLTILGEIIPLKDYPEKYFHKLDQNSNGKGIHHRSVWKGNILLTVSQSGWGYNTYERVSITELKGIENVNLDSWIKS